MNFKKCLKSRRAQSIIEYAVIFTVIIAAIAAANFLPRIQNIFRIYGDKQIDKIVNNK